MLSTGWQFYDPTESCSYDASPDSGKITVHSGPNTDWWSTAVGSVPESDAHRTSGPVLYKTLSCNASTNWTLSADLTQQGKERFQQTTLFVKLADNKWLKSGIENEDGMQYVGAVSANPFSDWCLTPMPDDHDKVRIQIEKKGSDLFIHYTYPDERTYLLREVKGFCPATGPQDWWLGVMVCGPKSQQTSGTAWDLQISVD